MAKKAKAIRGKFADEKYLGSEPDLRGDLSNSQIIGAYNWYNYFYDGEQAKAWVIEYWKEFHKEDKETIKNVNRISSDSLRTCGWNCRILSMGGNLPVKLRERMEEQVRLLAVGASRIADSGQDADKSDRRSEPADSDGRGSDRQASGSGSRSTEAAGRGKRTKGNGKSTEANSEAEEAHSLQVEVKEEDERGSKPVVSIQERIANRANELISEIEVELDKFYSDGTMFKPVDWLSQKDVKPAIAQRIADYYKPLYAELYDAYNGTDAQLREGYSRYKKPKLKLYMEFIKSIVSAAETRATVVKTRKPRKKKEKPASVIVAKLNYKPKDDDFGITSVEPKQVLGCNQLWVFNTKYRTLGVYNAMGPAGLSVKGSTLVGFDEKTSMVKKLRKPNDQLKQLIEGGKIVLRNFMGNIKCKPQTPTGRINKDTVLVRIVK